MYLLEFMIWYIQTSPREHHTWSASANKYLSEASSGSTSNHIRDSVSDTPCASGSTYKISDSYLDLEAGASKTHRGILTFISLLIFYMFAEFLYLSYCLASVWVTGVTYWAKEPGITEDYVNGAVFPLVTLGVAALVKIYIWQFIRWENFVQRRILIRFNRVTRQVYLHRPRYAGGITVLDWEKVSPQAAVGEEEAANIGRQLILLWDPAVTGLPHFHLVFVGKVADGTNDIVNLWEFIRRYMEEGPQSVPAPKKLLGKVPWPWLSVMASLSFFRPLWRAGLRWQIACIVALASPALALHAVGHWVSLLLCWEPRWPRIIREAGLPGKPVPPLSTAADWPPLPVAQPTRKQSGRTRKPLKHHTGQAQQGKDRSAPDSTSSAEKRHEDSTPSGESLNDSNKSAQ